jgi:hypothetical protein
MVSAFLHYLTNNEDQLNWVYLTCALPKVVGENAC